MGFNTYPGNPFPLDSERSGGTGESYTLPTASANTLGGVKVGDNLTIADGVLSAPAPTPAYVLPTASAETLGGVKVGSGLSIADGVLSANSQSVDYSTTETNTGVKWIDGKDIYRKVFQIDNLPNNATLKHDTGLSSVSIVKMYGLCFKNGAADPLPYVSTVSNYNIECWVDDANKITITTAVDYSLYNAVVVLEYTKTT